jgi:hypothetical protein
MTDVVDKLIIESEVQFADQSTAALKGLEGSLQDIVVVSDSADKSTASLENRFQSLERRFGTTQGLASQYAKIQGDVNLAVAQNPALQDRANAVMDAAATKFSAAGKELGHLDEIGAIIESRMMGLGNSMGLIGQVLQVIGPGGLAAAAGLGAIVVGIDQLVGSANRMGEVATKLYEISSATGVTTDSVQGLATAGVEFGLSTDQTGRFLERFARQLDAAHQGTGTLYTDLQKINPALASQMSASTSTADALGILATAFKSAADQSQRLALVTAAGAPRNSLGQISGLLGSIADKGSVDAVTEEVNKLDLITKEQTATWRILEAQITEASEKAKNNIASIYTGPVLETEKQFYDGLLAISRVLKDFSPPPEFKDMISQMAWLIPGINTIRGGIAAVSSFAPKASAAASAPNFNATFDAFAQTDKGSVATVEALNGSIGDQITKAKLLVSALGNAADATQKLDLKQLELQKAYEGGAFGAPDSSKAMELAAAAQDQLNIDNEIAQVQDRQKAKAAELADAYGGVSQSTALVLSHLDSQITVASAVGQAAKQQAQEQATINDLISKGTADEEAASIAAGQYALAQASIASAAQATHAASVDQLAVAQALTVPQQQQAQYQADYNAELLKTGDALLAQQAAQDKLAISQAKSLAAGAKAVQSSSDNLDILKATGTADEARVKSDVAYNDALRQGYSYAQAAAISADVLTAETIKSARAADQLAQSWQAAADAAFKAAQQAGSFDPSQGGSGTYSQQYGTVSAGTTPMVSGGGIAAFGDPAAYYNQTGTDRANAALGGGGIGGGAPGNIDAAIRAAEQTRISPFGSAVDAAWGVHPANAADAQSTVKTLYDLKNAQTTDKTVQVANDNQYLAWLNTQPETIARDQAIATLISSIQSLTTATNTNTAATDALSPYYAQDPRTSHIGFRPGTTTGAVSAGAATLPGMAAGGEITVPGGYSANDNMLVPVASGEIVSVRRPGQDVSGSSSQTISVTNHITIGGNASKDEIGRTMYQVGQNMARQLAAASR